jgi:hypothetical protein
MVIASSHVLFFNEHEYNLLEDTVYHRIQALWSDFSDAYAVFDENGPTQPFCA